MNLKKLDICVNFYNTNFEYFKNTISSILNQTNKNFNLIFLNDCSTEKYLKEYLENEILSKDYGINIEYYENETNIGCMSCRIELINKYSKSDYILLMDSDDILKPNAVDIILKNIDNNFLGKKDLDIIGFSYDYFYQNEKDLIKMNVSGNGRFLGYKNNEDKKLFRYLLENKTQIHVLWDKVFKRKMLIESINKSYNSVESLTDFCKNHKIFTNEDVYFLSVVMTHAKSYLSVDNKIISYNKTNNRHEKLFNNVLEEFEVKSSHIEFIIYLEKFLNEIYKNDYPEIYNIAQKRIIIIIISQYCKLINRLLENASEKEKKIIIDTYNDKYINIINKEIIDGKLTIDDENIL